MKMSLLINKKMLIISYLLEKKMSCSVELSMKKVLNLRARSEQRVDSDQTPQNADKISIPEIWAQLFKASLA